MPTLRDSSTTIPDRGAAGSSGGAARLGGIPGSAPATTIASTAVSEALPPDVLADPAFADRYAAGEMLGEGGMGVVRACADRRIGREVAMKFVKPGTGSRGDLAARFLREACVQGQLEHPSIVPVYDLGRDPDGTLYFTMKRVRGMTFERIVDALRVGEADAVRQFSRRKLLTAFASVCHAVDFAHARGVVHRDLKPGNVMLGDFGEVYVLDWGLAKVLGAADPRPPSGAPAIASGSDPGAKTVHGATMGTPGYMAPEQARGETVDVRADVYALGAILFELLALEPLHGHATSQMALDSTLAGTDARPSARAPNLDVPPELDTVCVRATAIEVAARTQSVREIVDAVERYLDGDRDLAHRRELARDHTRTAEQHAARALANDDASTEARSRALREVGRAIALDPTNEDAVRILMRLMTEPPRGMPPEARAAWADDTQRTLRVGARVAAVAYLSWFLYTPLLFWMGIRSWLAWTATSLAWLLASSMALLALRRPPPEGKIHLPMTVAAVVAVALTSTAFGPYFVVPSLAAIGSMLLHLAPDRGRRLPIVVLNSLAIVVPALLQLGGVIPSSYAFEGGTIRIVPTMLSFPPLPTHVLLLIANVALVFTGCAMIGRFRDALTAAEKRLHVTAWQLRQLVPEQVRPASAPPAAETAVQAPASLR